VIVVGGFNTAIDRLLILDELRPGAVNRVRRVRAMPGGKGLHVALTVAALGVPVTLVGLQDARHASWISGFLAERGVTFAGEGVDAIRTCLALRADDGTLTEVLEPGPQLDAGTAARLRERFLALAKASRLAVLSGSLPHGLPPGAYADLIEALAGSGVPTFLDTSGDALRLGCAARPALVKPNREEAGALRGAPIRGAGDALEALGHLQVLGPERVVLSLGSDGALACWDGRTALMRAPRVAERNPVGSGDCLLGGLAVGFVRGLTAEETLRLGTACGAANAQGEDTGIVARTDVERLVREVEVEWL